ncbi:MAG: hypothetical protein QM767_04340 [Anaeromyxobacter sp.]
MAWGWARKRWAGWAALAAGWLLCGCDPWRCDFDSHGACIEFETDPPDLAAAKVRVDRILDLEMGYWNLHDLSGWRVLYRDSADYVCYLSTRNDGCTDYPNHTLSVLVPAEARDCFEAAELLHELGHYELGDPMHANPAWDGVDPRFAPFVWDRPDAPASCVDAYRGIRLGVWQVHRDAL